MSRLLLAIALLGCSSSEPSATEADAGARTCAQTSCVPGASCRLPNGGVCQCFDAGEWSCGAGAPAADADFFPVFDTGTGVIDGGAAPPADTAVPSYDYPFDQAGCGGRPAACTDTTTIATAETQLRTMMSKCGLSCTRIVLEVDTEGCPRHVTANNDWIAGGFACVVGEISTYRWPCGPLLEAVTSGCPK